MGIQNSNHVLFLFPHVETYAISKIVLYLNLRLLIFQKGFKTQNQPLRGVLKKRCCENMQQIYRRTPRPKCGFNKVSNFIEIAIRHWCSPVNLLHTFSYCRFDANFQNTFSWEHLWVAASKNCCVLIS